MAVNKANPNAAQRSTNVERLKVYKTYKATVTTASQSLPTLLGEALQSDVGAVEVNNQSGGTISFQNGTAVAASAADIVDGQTYTFYGTAAVLDLVQIIAGSSLSVSFVQLTDI